MVFFLFVIDVRFFVWVVCVMICVVVIVFLLNGFNLKVFSGLFYRNVLY